LPSTLGIGNNLAKPIYPTPKFNSLLESEGHGNSDAYAH
jgi:hypothetical protein